MSLAQRADATPTRTALVDAETGQEWSYRDLDALVERAAVQLERRVDTERGNETRIGTRCSPSPAFVVAFHAVRRLGWTVVGLDTRLDGDALCNRIEHAAVELVVHDGTGAGGRFDTPRINGESFIDRTPKSAPEGYHQKRSRPTDKTAVILFTSGTTGEPKGVRLTENNLQSSAVASAFRLGVSPDDRWLDCLPVHHMGGLAPVVRTALYGTTLVTQRTFDADETGRVLDDHGVTGVSLVPTQLRRLLDAGVSLAALDTVLVGGAPTPEPLLERALDAAVSVYPTYGMTETSSQVATARPEEVSNHPGTVGCPLYGVTVRILADGKPVPAGDRGEVVVDGPTVTPGYLDGRDETFSEWGLHTGDIGYRDSDGRLWLLGREDELILTGGELVAPQEIVAVLCDHPSVADAAVVGLEDAEWGERVAALVVPDRRLSRRTLNRHCRERLAGYKRPKTVVFADSVPRTDSGTIDRDAVRTVLRDETES